MKLMLISIDPDVVGGMKMEGQNTNENVISLFSPRKDLVNPEQSADSSVAAAESSFEDAIRRNEENRKRMMQDRLKANKGVLKSYRIKN